MTKDALLLSERQEKDAIKKELVEAGERNEELLMKIEDTDKKIEHLQNAIIKFVPPLILFGFTLDQYKFIHSFTHCQLMIFYFGI